MKAYNPKPSDKPMRLVRGSMVTVVGGENKSIDRLLREFKKKIKEANVLEEYRQKQYYMKPSDKRRNKRNAARRKQTRETETGV